MVSSLAPSYVPFRYLPDTSFLQRHLTALLPFFVQIPFPFFFLAKKYPRSFWAKVHLPVLLNGAIIWNPYSTMANVWPQVIVAYIFQVYI